MRWGAIGVSLGLLGLAGCSSFVGVEEESSSGADATGTSAADPSGGPTGTNDPSAATSGSPATGNPTSGDPTSGDPTTGNPTEDPTDDTDPSETDTTDDDSTSTGPPPPSCDNGVQDDDETDVDCGGPCDRCDFGDGCGSGSDCTTGFCGLDSTCNNQPPVIWLDALDAGTMYSDDSCDTAPPTPGQQVYCWQNKGSADGMFVGEGGQPLYRESLDGLEFDNDPMVSENDIFGGDLGDVTVFIVQQELASRNSYDFNLNHPQTNGQRYSTHIPWGNSNRHIVWDIGGTGANARVETEEDVIAVDELHQFAFVNSAEEDTRAIRIDGEEAAASMGSRNETAGVVSVGRNARSIVHEFRVYVPSPSAQHREVIEGQLACKWGLRDLLPEEHPFHSADPKDPAGCPAELE